MPNNETYTLTEGYTFPNRWDVPEHQRFGDCFVWSIMQAFYARMGDLAQGYNLSFDKQNEMHEDFRRVLDNYSAWGRPTKWMLDTLEPTDGTFAFLFTNPDGPIGTFLIMVDARNMRIGGHS